MSETKQEQPRAVTLLPRDFGLAEHLMRLHVVNAPHGTTMEDCLKPEFWIHVASQIIQFDEIIVRAQDGSWRAHLFVTSVGIHRVNVKKLQYDEFDKVKIADAGSPVVIEYAGPNHRWRVKRKSDNKVLEKGFASEKEASDWWAEDQKKAA